jgi:glycerol-3-phosphate dehydrogenase
MTGAGNLVIKSDKMPEFIDPAKCNADGRCTFGCPEDAKRTAIRFVNEAERNGAKIITGMPVNEVVVKSGEVKGVRCGKKYSVMISLFFPRVLLRRHD